MRPGEVLGLRWSIMGPEEGCAAARRYKRHMHWLYSLGLDCDRLRRE